MNNRFEITIILSLIIAIVTVLYVYRKKRDRENLLFGNCTNLIDKIAAVVFSVFYILPSLGITFILLAMWKMDYMLIWILLLGGWIFIPLARNNSLGTFQKICNTAVESDLSTDKVPQNYPENDDANESYQEWGVGKQPVFREIDNAVKCRAEK